MVDICVTFVSTNEKDVLEKCLTSLYEDTKDSGLSLKIVIVDNASTDGTGAMIKEKFPEVQFLVQEKNEGFGKSHNRAIGSMEAKYYFVLNPDTTFVLGQHILKRMYEFMEKNPKVGMMGPKVVYPDDSLQYSCYRFPTFWQPLYSRTKLGKSGRGQKIADHFFMKDFDHNATLPVDWIMGSAMFVRKAAIDEVGVFDDRYWMYAEDSDWCRRMWEKNWAVYYVHDIVIRHIHGRSSAKVPGVINALLKNKYARVHLTSWFKYFWKWRGNHKYYGK